VTNEAQSHALHPEDLTLYAMGALDAPELARISKHVEGCAECRTEVQRINGEMALLALAASPQADPPVRLKQQLMAEVIKYADSTPTHARWNWAFAMAGVFGLVFLAVAIGEWRLIRELRAQNAQLRTSLAAQEKESEESRMFVETMKAPDAMRVSLWTTNARPQPQAHTVYSRHMACVILMANDLQPLQPGKMYQLWLIPMSGAKPIPAGMFKPDARGNAQMLHMGLPSGLEAKGFAVTIEPAEGSASPTGTPVLQGVES
jgi:anti-sigma-K factor RskA